MNWPKKRVDGQNDAQTIRITLKAKSHGKNNENTKQRKKNNNNNGHTKHNSQSPINQWSSFVHSKETHHSHTKTNRSVSLSSARELKECSVQQKRAITHNRLDMFNVLRYLLLNVRVQSLFTFNPNGNNRNKCQVKKGINMKTYTEFVLITGQSILILCFHYLTPCRLIAPFA